MLNQSPHLYMPSSPVELTIVAVYWLGDPTLLLTGSNEFLPRYATQSAVMPQYTYSGCPPVCPSAIMSVRDV